MLIYSKDAPALEIKLQTYLETRQVNLVNDRKEFFHKTLNEIGQAVRSLHGSIALTPTPEAKEYREARALRRERRAKEQRPI